MTEEENRQPTDEPIPGGQGVQGVAIQNTGGVTERNQNRAPDAQQGTDQVEWHLARVMPLGPLQSGDFDAREG